MGTANTVENNAIGGMWELPDNATKNHQVIKAEMYR